MAAPDLSQELRLVAWAALKDLQRDLRTQRKLADVLGVSAFTISNALRKRWASRQVLDAILRHLRVSEAELVARYGVVFDEGSPGPPEAKASSEPSSLTIAVARMVWDPRLNGDQRENLVRSVVELVSRWGTAEPSVQVWLDLLRSHELIALFGDVSEMARRPRSTRDEEPRRS